MKKLMLFAFMGLLIALFGCDGGNPVTASFVISPAEAEVGSLVTFDASASDGPVTAFEWNFGDGTFGSGMIVNHIYAVAKQMTVILTIRDAEGGAKTYSQQMDSYRAGKKLTLTKTHTGDVSAPSVWIDSVLSYDVQTGLAKIAINHDNSAHAARILNLWVILPNDLIEFINYETTKCAEGLSIINITNIPPNYLFQIDPDTTCFKRTNCSLLIIEIKLKILGSGQFAIDKAQGRDCWTNARFNYTSYSAPFQITMEKYYDQ